MGRTAFFVRAAFICVVVSLASFGTSDAAQSTSGYETELGFGVGYRTDDLDWNIAGDLSGQNPNVLSELTWSDLSILQVKGGIKSSIRRVYVRGSLGFGWILDGKNQDSDYAGDNRTLEFSRSNNSSDDGSVFDGSIGIGYKILDKETVIAPVAGYSVHVQRLSITDGFQTIPPLGPFPGLDSSYRTKWYGPWVGVDVSHRFSDKFRIMTSFEYHWADYEAKANWNLRTDLAHPESFRHWADGEGIVASAEAVFTSKKLWPLHLVLEYQDWQTDPGLDTVYFSDGSQASTRLNEVNWRSLAIMVKTSYAFR